MDGVTGLPWALAFAVVGVSPFAARAVAATMDRCALSRSRQRIAAATNAVSFAARAVEPGEPKGWA